MYQDTLSIQTPKRGPIDITESVQRVIAKSQIQAGLAHLFLQHTSASLMINENADPSVLSDLETVLARLAVDGDPAYLHDTEGPDDMAAHARTMLTHTDLNIPVTAGRLALGTWQGVFLFEHRLRSHTRSIVITVQGA